MADQQQELQFNLSLDTEPLKQGLSEAEELMRSGVERMNAIGQSGTAPIVPPMPIASAPAQPTQIQPPLPSPTPQAGESRPAIDAAWEELEKIKSMAKSSPDVALANLIGMGGGGLRSRAVRGAMTDPDSAEEYQHLILAIRDLTKQIGETIKQGESGSADPATGLLRFIRGNAAIGIAGQAGANLMNGNLLGAGGSLVGGALGFMFGGPGGAMAGSTIGNMTASGVGSLLSGADENRKYDELTADIAARFGDFGQEKALKVDSMKDMKNLGYSTQETAQLIDSLRQAHVIETADDSSKKLAESIQALTRATGQNTEAIVAQYSNYRNMGGQGDANTYMSQVMAGAVSAGMKSNLQDYSEILNSARTQTVYRSGTADTNDEGMHRIQGVMDTLLGGNSQTATLLRNNPAMANKTLNNFLDKGSAQAYSRDFVAMQVAGIGRERIDSAFTDPKEQAENAAIRTGTVFSNFLEGGGLAQLGMSREQLSEAMQKDPDFLKKAFKDGDRGANLQDSFRMAYQTQFGKLPTGDDINMTQALGANMLKNNGNIDLSAPQGDGKTLGDALKESQKTEGEKSREAAENRHKAMMALMEKFKEALIHIDNATAKLVEDADKVITAVEPIAQKISSLLGQSTNATGQPTNIVQAAGDAIQKNAGDKDPIGKLIGQGVTAVGKAADNPVTEVIGEFAKVGIGAGSPIGFAEEKLIEFLNNAGIKSMQGDAAAPNPFAKKPEAKKVHAKQDDTPIEGILSRPGFDTFQFAHGDIVHASPMGLDRVGANRGTNQTISLTIHQEFHGPADPEAVRSAAQSGMSTLKDEFLAQLEQGRFDNRDRRNNTRY